MGDTALAKALVTGDQDHTAVLARVTRLFGRTWRFLDPLVRRYLVRFPTRSRPRMREVKKFLAADLGLRAARLRYKIKSAELPPVEPIMAPVAAAAAWALPSLTTLRGLADWLCLEPEHLLWFADLKRLNRKVAAGLPLHHYLYRIVEKRSGGVRLIEQPKPRLKLIQRQILHQILDKVPVHTAVHGFVRGRSIKTFASPHIGRDAVLRMDLQDFFPSIPRTRIQAIFRTLGYPEPVADLLGGLCTSLPPRAVFDTPGPSLRRSTRQLYDRAHLPQGAPTSPALANICCHRLDLRLQGLSAAAKVAYTRYADDLAFSGADPFARTAHRFAAHAAAIAPEEGLAVNFRKTRLMKQSVRQSLAGIVVNQTANIARSDFDQLKAILTNCIRHGVDSQNHDHHPDFRAHLAGRIAWIGSINPSRATRLSQLFAAIQTGSP